MKKNTILALALCIMFVGVRAGLSANAAEARAAACLNRDCPGILLSRIVDEPQPDYSEECTIHEGCIATFKNIVAHIKVTYCSECNTVFKRELQAISSTQLHSKPSVIPTATEN